MADNRIDDMGDFADQMMSVLSLMSPKGETTEIVTNAAKPLDDTSGTFEGDQYISKERPKGNELIYFDDTTYEFLNSLYGSFDQSNEQTLKAQRILKDIGYYDGEMDGFYGNKIKGSIKRYLMGRNDVNSVWATMKDQGDLMEAASSTPSMQEDFTI